MSTTTPSLTEEEIDDLLYFARTSDIPEFSNLSNELCTREKCDFVSLIRVCRDGETGNGVLHMGAGNGSSEFITHILTLLSSSTEQTIIEIVNMANGAGNTPLHYAALNGHLECVKHLMRVGADPLRRNGVGRDSVFEAEVGGKGEVVEWVLREGGVDVERGVGGEGEGEGEEEGEGDGEEEVVMRLGELSVDGSGGGEEKGKGKEMDGA